MDLISTTATDGPKSGHSSPVIEVVIAEYQTLRAEIGRFQDHQQQILNFGFLALAAIVAGFGSALAGSTHPSLVQALRDYHLILLIAPIIYVFLALLFAERTIRIMRVGDYLDHEVREVIEDLTGRDLLRWEDLRRGPRMFAHGLYRTIGFGRLLDMIRWLAFIAPIGLCLMLLAIAWPNLAVEEWFLVSLDLAAFAVACWLAAAIDESSGVPMRPKVRRSPREFQR